MTDHITTLDAEAFKDSLFISIAVKSPGFNKKVRDTDKLIAYFKQRQVEIDAKREAGQEVDVSNSAVDGLNGSAMSKLEKSKGGITVTKRLLQSPALDRLKSHLNEAKAAIVAPPQYGGIANPSGIMEGLFELRKDLAEQVNANIEEAQRRLTETWVDSDGKGHQGLLNEFIADYPAAIERARSLPLLDGGLGPLFNPGDYPSIDKVRAAFSIERRWLSIGVPEGLPEALRQQAMDELRTDLVAAGDTIKAALREGLLSLMQHGKEVLTTAPGEKPKVIKESLIGNVLQFCDVFALRNTQGDTELAAIVDECKATLAGVKPEDCRKFQQTREETAAKFAELSAKIGAMIETKRGRVFSLED